MYSLFSNITSGSIPIFIRISLLGSARRSRATKRDSTHGQPLPKENTLRSPSDASTNSMPLEMQQTPPPKYMDATLTYPKSTFSPIKNLTPPLPSKTRAHSPTAWRHHAVDKDAMPELYMERSWDRDVERDGSVESDREGLVRNTKRWGRVWTADVVNHSLYSGFWNVMIDNE